MKGPKRVFFGLLLLITGSQLTMAKNNNFLPNPFFDQKVLLTYHTVGDEDYGYEYREKVKYKGIAGKWWPSGSRSGFPRQKSG